MIPHAASQQTRRRRPLPSLLAAAATLCLLAGCATPLAQGPADDGRRVWPAKIDPQLVGDGMLITFMPDDWPARMPEEEQQNYADWTRLLETFARRSQNVKSRRMVDFRSAHEFFLAPGLPVNEYSLLFVRGDNSALLAAMPIYDGAVYDYAEAFLGYMENDFYWQGILHARESDTGMPRALKRVRLKPSSTLGKSPPLPNPAAPPPAPQDPPAVPSVLPGPPVLYTPLP